MGVKIPISADMNEFIPRLSPNPTIFFKEMRAKNVTWKQRFLLFKKVLLQFGNLSYFHVDVGYLLPLKEPYR